MPHPLISSQSPAPRSEPIASFRDDYRFLSNFWFVPGGVTVQTQQGPLTGATTEHVFQALKTLDPAERRTALGKLRPQHVKVYGREVTMRPDWEQIKLAAMASLLAAKFRYGTGLAEKLLATGDALLVEGNAWCDTFWGVCTGGRECLHAAGTDMPASATDETGGTGQNWLGRLLMVQRSFLLARDQGTGATLL